MTHWPGIVAISTAFVLFVAAFYLYIRALVRGLPALRRRAAGPAGRHLTAAAVALAAACATFFAPAFSLRVGPHAPDAELRAAVRSHERWWAAAVILGGAVPLLTAAGLRRAWGSNHDSRGPSAEPPVS